jgi:hypothetical protein
VNLQEQRVQQVFFHIWRSCGAKIPISCLQTAWLKDNCCCHHGMQSVHCVCSAGVMTAAAGPDSIKPSLECKQTLRCTLQVGQASAPMQELLGENLKQADNLRLGQLENGLRYVMLPNKVPPQRFEAHLEMHAGKHACRHACKKGHITGRNDGPFCAKLVVQYFSHDP